MASKEQIDLFLASPIIGVVGASTDRGKFGNKVLRCYLQHNYPTIPVHPAQAQIEGLAAVPLVAELPDEVASISVITPPQITEKVVRQAVAKGIKNNWMQPGAQSDQALRYCAEQGVNLIADGTCVLVVLGCNDH